MFISDIIPVKETKMIFGRSGKKVVKKYRCSFGRKKGRIVSNPSVCGAIDIKTFCYEENEGKNGLRLQRKT